MTTYKGSCHCGNISFTFEQGSIDDGLRCNCSICKRKGAVMSGFMLTTSELNITDKNDSLTLYQFGSDVAKHYFCKKCGIYPFHETMRTPGSYRVNLGCVDGVDTNSLEVKVFDGKSL